MPRRTQVTPEPPPQDTTQAVVTRARTAAEAFRQSLPERITSAREYESLASALTQINSADRAIAAWFEPMKRAAHSAWRAICDQENESREALREAITVGRRLLNEWTTQRQREVDEARARQEALARALPAELQEHMVTTAAPAVVAPVVAGVQTRMRSVIEVNVRELCRAVADGSVPESLVTANMAAINRHRREGHTVPGISEVQVPQAVFTER